MLGPPDLGHLFSSDALGRDVFSWVLYAFRVSLLLDADEQVHQQ